MKERPDLGRLAAHTLASAPGQEKLPSPSEEAHAVALIGEAIRARKDGARRRRWAFASITVAAGVALAFGVAERRAILGGFAGAHSPAVAPPPRSAEAVVEAVVGDAYVFHGDQGRTVVEGSPVVAGDRLVVQRGGHVAFILPTGTRVAVDEGGDFAVIAEGATQLFRLGAGSMRADVHKLAQGERFVVRTRDGEVEVRGTSFRLSDAPSDPSCGGGTTTRLSVYDGVVAVRVGATETKVAAGEAWPPGCAGGPVGPVPSGAAFAVSSTPLIRSAVVPTAPAEASRTQLAEQNDMYSSAIAARERGDSDTAIAAFDRLIAKYPSCPLAENAFAERMKVLARAKSPRALQAARDYLVRYPAGFAREDANTILGGGAGNR
jgi:hypothetical protein